MKREEKTLNVFAKAVSEHFVPQLGHSLDDRRLEHIARISSDSSLTKAHEEGRPHG